MILVSMNSFLTLSSHAHRQLNHSVIIQNILYMYNTFIPIATLPLPVVRSSASRLLAPLCQNRQASTNSYVSCTSRCPGDAGPFVRTDKQAPRKQRVSEHSPQLHYTHQPLRPWTPWETFVRTDKQAVIHRLFTVCG